MLYKRDIFKNFRAKAKIITISLIILSALALTGCLSSKPVSTRYYIFEYPDKSTVSIKGNYSTVPGTCTVYPVEVSPAFATNQIAIRENTHEIRYFSFNQWAVRPEQGLTELLNRFLSENNIFLEVYRPSLIKEGDYILESRVYNLEVVSERKHYHARLSLEFILTDSKSGQPVKNHRADKTVPLEQRDLNLFASAISRIFIEEIDLFLNLYQDN